MLGQRRRRWPNINLAFVHCFSYWGKWDSRLKPKYNNVFFSKKRLLPSRFAEQGRSVYDPDFHLPIYYGMWPRMSVLLYRSSLITPWHMCDLSLLVTPNHLSETGKWQNVTLRTESQDSLSGLPVTNLTISGNRDMIAVNESNLSVLVVQPQTTQYTVICGVKPKGSNSLSPPPLLTAF